MTAGDAAFAQAQDVARMLLGAPVEVNRFAGGGLNSRIYNVRFKEEEFALKQYPLSAADTADRLAAEVGALRLMERQRIDGVPRVVGVDRDRGYALLTWIDGSLVREPTNADVDAALAFLETIHGLRRIPWSADMPPAAEACLSGAEIDRQIGRRFARLQSLESETELLTFLDSGFRPAWRRAVEQAKADTRAAGGDFSAELPQDRRSLIPADFGFHNSLRRRDGSLAFIDFEYFGWDDPVKLTADTLLHPGTTLAASQSERFRRGAARLYGGDPAFERRLDAYLPLFALRWTLIVLNEFIPERWERRLMSGMAKSWTDAKADQLAKARAMLASLPQTMCEPA